MECRYCYSPKAEEVEAEVERDKDEGLVLRVSSALVCTTHSNSTALHEIGRNVRVGVAYEEPAGRAGVSQVC